MKYICAQPENHYFSWQLDVMLYSFQKAGIEMKDVHILASVLPNQPKQWFSHLEGKYPGISIHRYKDGRPDKSYIPSIKHYLLFRYYEQFPETRNDSVFFHDSDIAFTKNPSLDHLCNDDIWYLSDTKSYLGYNYIMSKGRDTLETMLITTGIDEDTVKKNEDNSGGAQYIVKNVDAKFWYDCYSMGVKLYKMTNVYEKAKKKADPNYHMLQVWTAEMWATLWMAWMRGIETRIHPDMDFCWATDPIKRWDHCSIYHNAGVTSSHTGMFYKGAYIHNDPFASDLKLDEKKCSYQYYGLLKEASLKN